MTKWQFNRPDGPFLYSEYGFEAVSGAILDGSTLSPPLTTAPDFWWTVYGGGSAQTGITIVSINGWSSPLVEPADDSVLVHQRNPSADTWVAPEDFIALPAVAASLAASYGHKLGALQPFMRKVDKADTATVAILSDSTDDSSVEWGHLLGERLATSWPTRTVTWTPPLNDAYAAGTTDTIQTGTSGSVVIWNNAISGSSAYNWQSADFLARLETQAPDLVVIATGHNEGTFTGDPQTLGYPREAFRLRLLAVVEDIKQRLPLAQIVLVAQHEWSDGTGDMDQKRDEIQYLSRILGCGFIDMYQAFHDAGAPLAWYDPAPGNIVHLNATGEAFYADTIAALFKVDTTWEPRPSPGSLFDRAHPGNLADDMVMPLTATGPIGWTLDNATVSRDTTHFESQRGYAIRVQRTAGGAKSRIDRQILDSTSVLPYRGKWLLIGVRMYRPAAGDPTTLPPAGNRFVGRLAVSDGVGGSKNAQDDKGYGGFMWRFIPHKMDVAATSLTVSLYADYSNAGDATNPDVTFDRFYVIPGQTPVGHTRLPQAMRNSQTLEGLDVGASTGSTQSRVALFAAASIQRLYAIYSGVNRIWQITTSGTESGSNVGGDLAFQAYDDSGSLLFTILTLNRRFGLAKWRSTTTAARPSASSTGSGAGAMVYDSDIKTLILSDGTVWAGAVLRGTGTVASAANPTIATGSNDYYYTITAQAAAITSFTTNLTGTPVAGQRLHIAITDNGTARAITWGASFEASTVALPTTTVISTRLDVQFVWNVATSKWRCVSVT